MSLDEIITGNKNHLLSTEEKKPIADEENNEKKETTAANSRHVTFTYFQIFFFENINKLKENKKKNDILIFDFNLIFANINYYIINLLSAFYFNLFLNIKMLNNAKYLFVDFNKNINTLNIIYCKD